MTRDRWQLLPTRNGLFMISASTNFSTSHAPADFKTLKKIGKEKATSIIAFSSNVYNSAMQNVKNVVSKRQTAHAV